VKINRSTAKAFTYCFAEKPGTRRRSAMQALVADP
jgi:hypothetical protein